MCMLDARVCVCVCVCMFGVYMYVCAWVCISARACVCLCVDVVVWCTSAPVRVFEDRADMRQPVDPLRVGGREGARC